MCGVQNETVVRAPGQLQGQQFVMDGCDNCDIFLLDHSAQVMVDYCTNCRIFIAPCESSVFLRNCTGCKFVIACQQLRTRDCEDNDVLLFCQTQPSIETTTKLRLGCFQAAYFALGGQFADAKLSVWNNEWSRSVFPPLDCVGLRR